jgi:hypothetical protein
MENLKLPVTYLDGGIVDADGKEIIKANRNSNETPLLPTERDELLKTVVSLINANLR